MKILAIDTSCDETSVAVTEETSILANVLWSQASLHTKWGGVFPSLAKRAHAEHIDWVINKALTASKCQMKDIGAIAVTQGPGLAIALEVGINKAKELAIKFNLPLIAVNHIEGHLLSVFANPPGKKSILNSDKEIFPTMSLVASGKHTDLIYVERIGEYRLIASTTDDALGEALDKAARMLGLGYPGGPILEKMSEEGDVNYYALPVPMVGKEMRFKFSYSGLKTAMYKLVETEKVKDQGSLSKKQIHNLAAVFQDRAFQHVERMVVRALNNYEIKSFTFGGGVSANTELRKRLRKINKKRGLHLLIPYSKKLCTDNAGMIGVAAYFKVLKGDFVQDINSLDRIAHADINFQ